jgi:Bacteriophage HK97-gp10, putative tail-component
VSTEIILDQPAIDYLCSSPSGPVAVDLIRRAIRVTNAAKALCPVDGGRLRASITYVVAVEGGDFVARVGTAVGYGRYVEEGTGIYGPRGQVIAPTHRKALVFTPKGANAPVFVRSVKGMKPRPYLRPALAAAA